jgi:GTP-binding protein LepA
MMTKLLEDAGTACAAYHGTRDGTGAEMRGGAMCEKLRALIPQHLFQIPIQAAIAVNHPARDHPNAAQGGDREVLRRRRTCRRKLLEKKEGKKRMRQFGKVEIPQEAFIQALKMIPKPALPDTVGGKLSGG